MIDVPFVRLGAALGLSILLAQPAGAFSQIGTRDGAATQREGIVSVPLPPLAGTTTPGVSATPTAGPDTPPDAATDGTLPAPASEGAEPAASPEPAGETQGEEPAADPGDPDAAPLGETAKPPSSSEMDPADIPAGAIAKTTGEEDAGPPPVIVYGDEGLPQPVKDLREKLMAIAKSGEIEALRPYIQVGEEGTLLSFGEANGDPIQFLKSASGDGEGVEILAIMLEVLEAGHVRNEPTSDNEIFVWPYFTAMAVDTLTKPQKVELFELVTAGDYQEMLGFGAYNFYRMGISPDGKLQFFVAGD